MAVARSYQGRKGFQVPCGSSIKSRVVGGNRWAQQPPSVNRGVAGMGAIVVKPASDATASRKGLGGTQPSLLPVEETGSGLTVRPYFHVKGGLKTKRVASLKRPA